MEKEIHCPCGTVLRSSDEKELIRLAQQHAREAHEMELSPEEALAMARPA